MINRLTLTLMGLFTTASIILMDFESEPSKTLITQKNSFVLNSPLKETAYKILNKKCNSCHRKQNPFMVFNKKNMIKQASKIYDMVFVKQRMPKGYGTQLTNQEYTTLKKWLQSEQIF